MDYDFIESAYEPFVTELRNGHFATPTEGWSAELVAAHIAVNNDQIAEAAEAIVAGQRPRYVNGASVDEIQLLAYVKRCGDRSDLATAVELSARRLANAAAALDEGTKDYALPVQIIDGGEVVRDGPVPIGEFIQGNATFHLDIHLEQLQNLRS